MSVRLVDVNDAETLFALHLKLAEAERWAGTVGLHRLELTVMATNTRAIRLDQRSGFVREGTRVRSPRVGGAGVDEHSMAKLLGPPAG